MLEKNPTITKNLVNDITEAFESDLAELTKKAEKEETKLSAIKADIGDSDPDNKKIREYESSLSLLKEKIDFNQRQLELIRDAQEGEASKDFLENAKAQLSTLLDDRMGKDFDQELLKDLVAEHSAKYEKEYLEDMKNLGVRPPDVLTRVE
mgnify:CR=1 FL=1